MSSKKRWKCCRRLGSEWGYCRSSRGNVILSAADAKRSEAPAESKDPYHLYVTMKSQGAFAMRQMVWIACGDDIHFCDWIIIDRRLRRAALVWTARRRLSPHEHFSILPITPASLLSPSPSRIASLAQTPAAAFPVR